MTTILPNVTASLNAISSILLVLGYLAIRKKRIRLHKTFMICALISSTLFLIVYITHHAMHGSTPYPFYDWTRSLYFVILIPHVILAIVMVPFILRGVWLAWAERFEVHAKLMRWVLPVWLYVSVTGVVVYLMLYIIPPWRSM